MWDFFDNVPNVFHWNLLDHLDVDILRYGNKTLFAHKVRHLLMNWIRHRHNLRYLFLNRRDLVARHLNRVVSREGHWNLDWALVLQLQRDIDLVLLNLNMNL